ncbi:MAG: GTPase ObgE [candidate division WOR-3 bacterium]|nr:GTPase ObgE [candidate division WOR-3 bacterium]MCX7757040.1 GTPase ObgE [candidate division WOR-3 bacterium]MDW7987260.1 GTPase ObgE [candidate division WOR-3 bacterium]
MKFVDQVVIEVEAGAGGDGCISFRREKFVPRGGPDGGNGGNGGSVYLIGKANLQTLADLEYHCRYKAQRGEHGKGSNRDGKNGADVYVPVPLGTDVYDADTNEFLGEILKPEQILLVARGGKGGRGNKAFATSTNRAPRIREKGKPGEKRRLKLILRLIADIGLVGLPNAGKSTLLSQLTSAHPKIADYPFTTLTPNLGVLKSESLNFTIADMPGIIEGASSGKGLGLIFLRHIERTKVIVYVIDISQKDPLKDLTVLITEIKSYNQEILKKKQVVVFNKIDLLKRVKKYKTDFPTFYVSALTGKGISELKEYLKTLL